jgi:hypothetical protein
MKMFLTILGVALIAILIIAIGPFLTIWAVNTLFPSLAIPFNLYTWSAVIILGAFFRANVSVKKDK